MKTAKIVLKPDRFVKKETPKKANTVIVKFVLFLLLLFSMTFISSCVWGLHSERRGRDGVRIEAGTDRHHQRSYNNNYQRRY